MSEIDTFLNDDQPAPKGAPKSEVDAFLEDSPPPARGFGGWARDIAATAVKGAIAVPEAVVGLADIPTGGAVGKFLENEGGAVGFRPKQAKEFVNDLHSDATKQAQQKFQEAEGLGGKLQAAIENPSVIASAVGESLPSMAAGGVAARGLMAATRLGQMGAGGAALAGAAGEGLTMAGSAAEQIRQETDDGLLTPGQAALAGATGLVGAAVGAAGGKIAQKLGIGDVDTLIAQGAKGLDAPAAAATPLVQQQALKSIPKQIIQGAIAEGFLEELPQSVAETVFQNLALGKDWAEGVDAAIVLGTLSGAAMGGGAAGFKGAMDRRAPEQAPANPGTARVRQAYEQNLLALPAPQINVGPDGTAQTAADRNTRLRRIQDGDIFDVTPITKRSEQMGLNPAAGPMSAAAATAVDTGAADQVQQQAALAQAAEAAAKAPKGKAAEAPAAKPAKRVAHRVTGTLNGQPITTMVMASTPEEAVAAAAQSSPGMVPATAGPVSEAVRKERAAKTATPPATPGETNLEPQAAEPVQTGAKEPQAQPAPEGLTDGQTTQPTATAPNTGPALAPAAGRAGVSGVDEQGAVQALSNVQDAPQQPAGTEAQAAPSEARAPEGGNAAATGGVPAAGQDAGVRADGVKPDGGLVKVKLAIGGAVHVKQSDIDGSRTQLPIYTADGKRKDGTVHRDNLDPTGEKLAQSNADIGDNPLFDIITRKEGFAFATKEAAQRELNQRGLSESHEVVEAPRGAGFIGKRKPAATGAGDVQADGVKAAAIAEAAHQAATSPKNDLPQPTEAQKEAGNYQKGHARIAGHDITIENPAGSKRRPEWPALKNHYGYFKGSVGADKDHVDVFMTDRAGDESLPVFVVDQTNRDGTFDEHKIIMGTADEAEARATYLQNYEKGWTGLGAITQMSQDEFKAWVRDPAKTKKPVALKRGVLAKMADQKRTAALDRIAKGTAYFGTKDKADEFITKSGIGDTHEVVQAKAGRFEIRAKGEKAPAAAPQPAAVKESLTDQEPAAPAKNPTTARPAEASAPDSAPASAKPDPLTEKEKAAKAKMLGAAAKLADLLSKNTRANITPEQEQKMLPIVIELFEGAMDLGYVKFKQAARYVREFIASAIDQDAADSIPIDTLQGAYIATARRHADKDITPKGEVVAVESIADLDEPAVAEPGAKTLTESLYQAIRANEMPKDNPALKKLVEAFDGKPADQERMKQAQESLETAIVMVARDMVAKKDGDRTTFDILLRLYERQPNLNIRTSTSIANQAYSTPAPLAYLASRLAGITKTTVAHEPTGGTGMLLIGADPDKAIVNELNDTRIEALKAQGFKPTQNDAATQMLVPEGTQPDAVVTNPPFGSIKDADGKPVKVKVDGFSLGQIDHLIAARALDTMKEDGRATLILGANKVAGGLSTDDRIFFNWLYSHYNVVGHFEIEGDLYNRQGAGWPVRVITINGRQKSDKFSPVAGTIQRVDNWDAVYEQFTQSLASAQAPRSRATPSADSAGGRVAAAVVAPSQTGAGRPEGGARGAGNVAGASPRVVPDRAKPAAGPVAAEPDEQRLNAQPYVPQPQPGQSPDGAARPAKPAGTAAVAEAQGNEFQLPYTPRSSRKDEGVLIPANMAQPTQDALSRLEDEVGDIDEFARKELGYETTQDLHEALMGLQVDSVATSIYQIKQGKAVVIADQTGIGKGRQAASIIRWAARQGMTPVFVSVKPSLFTDMYGDLADIGTTDVTPFIMNSDAWVAGEGGAKLFANKPGAHKNVIQEIANTGRLPEGSNAVFMTYSQINVANVQRQALMALAPNAVFVLDESHNAAGASATGEFVIGTLEAAKGVVYLSATYAKRPDNMPLYFKTDIGEAAADTEGLSVAMASGGLPLQTVVSNNLVKAGQMFRRERSYDGVSIASVFDSKNRELHERMSNEATKALRAIVSADRMFHEVYVKQLADQLAAMGATVQDSAGNQIEQSVQHTEFSSVVHNFVKQMLLGLKAQSAADEAIASLKRGEKPIIAVENTMGSFLNEYAATNGIGQGDSLGTFDYRTVLSRALARSRVVIEVGANGDKVKRAVSMEQLDSTTKAAYNEAQAVIDNLTLDIPVSPIDWMRSEITRAGYKVAEITGRNLSVDYTNPKKPELSAIDALEQKDKVNTTRQFNSGNLDALILNVAGSTGISLHASEKFEDQRQRHMVVAQAAGDINIFMQMLGRVHRTGQVRLPKYTILSVDLPTEKRPTAVLSIKMKSLNANTSSNTESAASVKSSDILNKYGDQIVNQYLRDNYALARALDLEDSIGDDPTEDIARKATGRLALQPIATQHTFYDEVEAQYNALIDYLNKTNQNDLEPRTFDFDAKEIRQEVLFDGPNKDTPFGEDAIYGEYSIKAQGTPMKPEEIRATMAEHLGALTPAAHAQKMLDDLDAKFNTYYVTLDDAGKDSASSVRNIGRDFLSGHKIGATFRVDINSEPFNAVVMNVRNTHKETGNPYSLSKIQVSVAINGALRSLSVPATQFSKIEVSSIPPVYKIEQLFKEQPPNQRETSKIITGNLLAAYGEMQGVRGTIISFTKQDGTTEQGILLPKLFDYGKNTRGDFRLPSGAAALHFLQESDNKDIGRFGIMTRDGNVRVLPSGQGIRVQVPKSKLKGGKYFLDKGLIEAGGDFVSSGSFMASNVTEPADAVNVLDLLMKKQALYALPSMADEAKALTGNKAGPEDDANFGTKGRAEGTPADRAVMAMAGEGKSADDILRFIANASKSKFNRQVANLLRRTGANPAVSLGGDMGGGAGFRFLAKYSRKNHEVTLSQGAADRAEQIFLHETVHAATLLALDRGGEHADRMKALYESVKKQGLSDAYGMKNVGEFVAEAFSNKAFQKLLKGYKAPGGTAWDRFVAAVRRILGMSDRSQDALSAALEMGVEVMRENMPLRKARSFSAEDAPAFAGTNQAMTEEQAIAKGFTMKAYRGVSKATPFNDTGTTWLTTSREVAEAYAEEVMGYDDPGVIEVMVNPSSLKRHDASRLTDEQREQMQADDFGNPQAIGIYDRSDDHPLGGSRRNVTVIHAPREAVAVIGNDTAFAGVEIGRKESEANRKEFLDGSKVRQVVYHATRADFNAFDTDKSDLGAHFGNVAQANRIAGGMRLNNAEGTQVMPVWLSIKNPLRLKDVGTFHADGIADQLERKGLLPKGEGKRIIKEIDADWKLRKKYDPMLRQIIQDAGYDGVVYANTQEATGDSYIVFRPEQIKSATGNNGNFDPEDDDIAHFGMADAASLKQSALDQIHQTLSHPGKVSVWDKTVGTMRNLAERSPAFKPVFDAAQRFIDDVSLLANETADVAPRLLPRVESWRDLTKKPVSAEDNQAIGKPIFEGTLMWARDADGKPVLVDDMAKKYADLSPDKRAKMLMAAGRLDDRVLRMWQGLPEEQFNAIINSRFESQMLKAGVVWTDGELKSLFNLTDQQISLYREARQAIDRSIDLTARADMLRAVGAGYAGMRDVVLEAPTLADARDLLVETLHADALDNEDQADRLTGMINTIADRFEKATSLMKDGYAPLSRFGRYTVDVVDAAGERQFFGMAESMRDANQLAGRLRAEFPGATVTQGTMSAEAYKLFAGITPESLELFGNMLGLDAEGGDARDKAFQEYLKLSKNNHSALKRLMHRKGIAGYSEDVGRVLASFVYSNARQAAGGLNAGTMEEAVNAIPKDQGELKDVAMGLRDYVRDPQEEGQAVRGMLFAQYLGGSVASAFVNMTQPVAVTLPWLSQFGGMKSAGKHLAAAFKDMAGRSKYEDDLQAALDRAEEDGVVSPQEIHMLMAQARGAGGLRSGDGTRAGDARAAASNAWERTKVAWGQPFALAEQFNRRSTFIAAYRMAKENRVTAPAEFARRAVLETQFLYSRANKPRWARGVIGGTLFTFKTYSVSYLELLNRMATAGKPGSPERAAGRRAVAWAMVTLMLMGGAGGLPFMEDLEDLIDGIAQLLGYNVSAKQWRRQALQEIVGKELGDFIDTGASGLPGAPIDVSGRLGMGNLIPGTGLLMAKQNRERDLLEVVGPAGDLVTRGFTGARKALSGDIGGAALELSPTAVRNAAKGIDMAITDRYTDAKGYKVLDTTLPEAAAKFVGLQPRSVAKVQEANSFMMRSKAFYTQTSSEIKAQWARALYEKDDDALQAVRERLADWNRNNPDQPIVVKMPDVWKRVREMGKDRTERIADTAPKALRQEMRNMAREAG